ncbi:MAG: cytochrome P450 [Enhygromyxa sp.]
MTIPLLSSAFVCSLLAIWLWRQRRQPLARLPGPPVLPVIGSLPWINPSALHETFRAFQRYGEFVRFTVFGNEFVLVYRPEHIKEVLVTNRDHYSKGPSYRRGMGPYLGNSLIVADDEEWKPQRALLQPLFTPSAMNRYVRVIESKSAALCTHLDALLGERDAMQLQMSKELRKVLLDFIGAVGFGHDFGAIEDVGVRQTRIVTAIDTCLEFSQIAGCGVPYFLFRPLVRRYEVEKAWIQGQIRQVIRGQGGANTILGCMQASARQPGNEWLTEENMIDQTFGFLLAGFDTTAHPIACILQMLCEHPDVYARLQAEIDACFDKHGGTLPASFQALQAEFGYLDQINDETLRLFPSVPAVGRYTKVSTQIGGQAVPAGVTVIVPAISTHLDAQHWDQPEIFDPSRFATNRQPRVNGAPIFLPFVHGPRNCIGLYLSKLYTFIFVPLFLRHYQVRLPDGVPKLAREHLRSRVTLTVTTGLPMEIRRR